VPLVLPQPSLFTERERPASASVFLKLGPGTRLTTDQVRGIVHLVASSVEGLSPERVTVLDTAGRMLLAATDGGAGAGLSPRRLEIKTAVEEGLERRVQSLLDSVLGPGQAVTRVSAQLNFDQVERTEERFDPTPVVRQETRTVETSRASSAAPVLGAAAPPAAPGAPPAAPPPPPASTTANDGNRESESVSYEISKVVARTLTSPGEVQRVSVAVLLNAPARPAGGAPGAAPATRSAEELEKIRRVVMGAVGYNQVRGDEVTVVEMPFDTTVLERERAAPDAPQEPRALLPGGLAGQLAAAAATGVIIAGALLFFTRRRARDRALDAVTRTLEAPAGPRGAAAASAAGLTADALGEADGAGLPDEFLRLGRERKGLRQRAVALAQAEPEATAQLLRAWMVRRRARPALGGGADG
jgi:flagellar M-ring protein FliF